MGPFYPGRRFQDPTPFYFDFDPVLGAGIVMSKAAELKAAEDR
jgi:hypothetical protein